MNINGHEIDQINGNRKGKPIRFLGIHIDGHLTRKCHIQLINTKISPTLFTINKAKDYLPKAALRAFYLSFIHSQILYDIIAWGQQYKIQITIQHFH